MSIPSPEPGIYADVPSLEYRAWEAVNHSTLEGFRRTPAHALELMMNPKPQTAAQALGHALHVAILEPERYARGYYVAPEGDGRKTEVKLARAEAERLNHGRVAIKARDAADIAGMREAVMAHPWANELLSGKGENELSIVWRDEATGLLVKNRLDRLAILGTESFVIDLKTTEDAGELAAQKSLANYGYYRQGSIYRYGMNVLRPRPRRVVLVFVESAPPYGVAVYEIDERALDQGEREWRAHLERFATCVKTGTWPAYDQGMQTLRLRPWDSDEMNLASPKLAS